MFLEELQDLKNRYPDRFQLVNVLSREAQDVELFSGRLDRERLERRILDLLVPVDTVDEWYLCGPFGMVEDARAVLAERGADPHHVHHELFHVDGQEPPGWSAGPSRSSRRRAARGGRHRQPRRPVDGHRHALPRRDDPGGDPAVAPGRAVRCTGGVCGTCRARVVRARCGWTRNYALEPEEVAAGIVLACQAHPVTDAVALDYDA